MSFAQTRAATEGAQASAYLQHLPDVVKERPRVFCALFCRESNRSQEDHLRWQRVACKKAMLAHGLDWRDGRGAVFGVIGPANPANAESARQELAKAIAIAKQNGGIVLAESTSRFIRSDNYNSKSNRNARATAGEFAELMQLAGPVPLVTIHHPDLTPMEELGRQTKRGMMPRDRRGGRPRKMPGSKKTQRLNDEPEALALRQEGKSLGEISTLLARQKSTVQYWCRSGRTKFPPSGGVEPQ